MTTLFKKYGPAVVMGVLSIALPQIALGIALLAGGVTLTCAIAMQITRKKRSNRS